MQQTRFTAMNGQTDRVTRIGADGEAGKGEDIGSATSRNTYVAAAAGAGFTHKTPHQVALLRDVGPPISLTYCLQLNDMTQPPHGRLGTGETTN